MAAMCDVAFLILIFFVLTAKPKPLTPMQINLPFASQQGGELQDNISGILIGHGKVGFEIVSPEIRRQTLVQMGNKYHIKFSPSEISKFGQIDIVSVPMSELKQYIDGYYSSNAFFNQSGIPIGSNNYELANWIFETRKAYKSAYDNDLNFEICADEKTKYPQIEYLMNILGKQNIYKFGLITNLKYHK